MASKLYISDFLPDNQQEIPVEQKEKQGRANGNAGHPDSQMDLKLTLQALTDLHSQWCIQ
jgi:hypothetical protein